MSDHLSCTYVYFFFFSSRRRHTRFDCDWSSDVCSSDLLQEKVEGTSAKDICKLGDDRPCRSAADRCGRWLGRFQTLAPTSGRTSGIARFLTSAERKCRLLSEADRAWMVRTEQLLERLKAAAPFLDPGLACAGHGDFCEHQIILTEGRTVVFDWDLHDIAHPARDVAKFIVS